MFSYFSSHMNVNFLTGMLNGNSSFIIIFENTVIEITVIKFFFPIL